MGIVDSSRTVCVWLRRQYCGVAQAPMWTWQCVRTCSHVVLLCTLVLSLGIGTARAYGALTIQTMGGSTCRGSSGYGAMAFDLGMTAGNKTTVTQYLICGAPTVRDPALAYDTSGASGMSLSIVLATYVGTPRDFTCAAVIGRDDQPGLSTVVVKQLALAALETRTMNFTPTELPIRGDVSLVVNCAMPPQGHLVKLFSSQPKNY